MHIPISPARADDTEIARQEETRLVTRRHALSGAAAVILASLASACGARRVPERQTVNTPVGSPPNRATSLVGSPETPASGTPSTTIPGDQASPTTQPSPRGSLLSESRVNIRPDGTTLINGAPFFPIGFYNVSYERDGNLLMDDVRLLGEAGFNIMHLSVGGESNKDWARIYEEAARHGVYLLPEDTDRGFVTTHQNKPSAFGWSIWDDVNPVETDYDALLAKYRDYRQWDPNHVAYYAVGGDDAAKTFMTYNTARRGDAFGLEAYPVNNAPIAEIGPYMRKAVTAAAKFGQSPYGVLQAFNLSQNRKQRAPTFREFYNMTYQGVVAGLKGIIYYTFYDTGNYLPSYTELWAGSRTLPAEIERIKPFLLNGKRTTLDPTMGVTAASWEHGNDMLVIIVNALESRDATKSVSLALPFPVNGSAHPVFSNRPSGFTFENGHLSGAIEPYDVHVYVLNNQPSINRALLG